MDAASLFQSLTSRPDAQVPNIITGTAMGASADGNVLVQVDGSAVAQPSEEQVTLTVPTDEFAGGSYVLPSVPYPGTLTVEDDNGDALEEDDYELDVDELTIFALSSDPVSITYDAEVRQALTNEDFASGSVTVDSTTNLTLLEDVGGPGTADWQPCAYTLDGNELTVAGIDVMAGVVEFAYQRSVSLVGEPGDMLLPDVPDPDDVAVTGRLNGTDYVVTTWTLDQDQLTLPSGYDTFTVDYVMDEVESWNITDQYEDEPLQDSDDAADPATVTIGHDLQHEPDTVTSCTVDGVAATYTINGLNVVADSPAVTERSFTLSYEVPVALDVPASEFATGPYELPYEPLGTVTTICGGVVLANSVSGLDLTVSDLLATSAYYTISYTAQAETDVVELPCTPAVSEGQFVDIAIVNGMPTVIGASGSGDAVAAAADAAESAATAAQAVANAVNQHFWTDGSGVHVTEVTQTEWNDSGDPNYQSGANQLSNSAGILLRDGLTNFAQLTPGETAFYDGAGNASTNVVATFGTSGSVIGKAAESHAFIDYHSLQMVDKEGSTYFYVSDLRDSSGYADVTEERAFVPAGVVQFFATATPQSSGTSDVKVNGTSVAFTLTDNEFMLSTPTPANSFVTLIYKTADQIAKAYTLGIRRGVAPIGLMSTAEGYDNAVIGSYSHGEGMQNYVSGRIAHAEGSNNYALGVTSHVEGTSNEANGTDSHAEGNLSIADGEVSHAQNLGTIAASDHQTALGRYNVRDAADTYAVIIGNGTADNARSNALTVDWSGNVEAAGDVVAANIGAVYSADLDDLVTPGLYYASTSATNSPVSGGAGSVTVNATGSASVVVQTYVRSNNEVWVRSYVSGAWTSWECIGEPASDTAITLSNASANVFSVRRSRPMVTLYVDQLELSSALASGSSVSIGTIPDGYRPAYRIGVHLAGNNTAAARGAWLYIPTSGNVSVYNNSGSNLAAGTKMYGCVSWVL